MSLALQANISKVDILKDRAEMLAMAREFFRSRNIIEVDCPIMNSSASVDVHIDLIRAYGNTPTTHYLHPSPEYGMKKLLAEGIGDIFQLSHVFRDNEMGMKHNQEFTMAEWYRVKMPFSGMIVETIDFIRVFLGHLPYSRLTYREAFKRYAGLDYLTATEDDLLRYLEKQGIDPYDTAEEEGKDALLNIILAVVIEPHLGKEDLCVLKYFPASQAMLAKTRKRGGEEVSERFEIFYKGMELANGFNELTNAQEQHERLLLNNRTREHLGKETLPIDQDFIKALEKGLPDCCGVAVGFDRLMMLRHNMDNIDDVIP